MAVRFEGIPESSMVTLENEKDEGVETSRQPEPAFIAKITVSRCDFSNATHNGKTLAFDILNAGWAFVWKPLPERFGITHRFHSRHEVALR